MKNLLNFYPVLVEKTRTMGIPDVWNLKFVWFGKCYVIKIKDIAR